MYLWILEAKISKASSARSSPLAASPNKSRKSLEVPEIPNNPDSLFKTVKTSSAVLPVFSIINGIKAGSISPERVPIVTPANGVKPIDVSIDFPPSIAAIDAPLPIWQEIIRNSSIGFSKISAARRDTYLWLVPWKPYLRIPKSS